MLKSYLALAIKYSFSPGRVAYWVCYWSSAPKGGFTLVNRWSTQVGGFSRCRKLTTAMSYDYTASKISLECLFGLDVLGKIKSCYVFASSELRCLPLGRKLGVRITSDDCYPPIGHQTKK
ncbi:hypothetical protein TNCV_324011 [Trichonephila clavipes]|nr:hypothetical protein TNCV_324011 [Trichonephila clavipes]